ncbi:MAG: hypothetical protein CMQ19_10355 [Gammaproteobacteria bacterium]|nr:hypothetical protein [Gammaproteobacteria bacterium]
MDPIYVQFHPVLFTSYGNASLQAPAYFTGWAGAKPGRLLYSRAWMEANTSRVGGSRSTYHIVQEKEGTMVEATSLNFSSFEYIPGLDF